MTLFDQLSAVIELGYSDEEFAKDHSKGVVQGSAVAAIGSLSDEYWQRFARDSVSPAKLAEWQELCSTTEAPANADKQIRDIADLLASEFASCAGIPVHRDVDAATGDKTCIVTAPTDSVTPQVLIKNAYRRTSPGVTWVESKERQHGSFDGLSTCLDVILPQRPQRGN